MTKTFLRRYGAICMAALIAACPAIAEAQSLREALIAAYQSSPVLENARAQLRATDEGVAQARAGRRPSVSANADVGAGTSSNSNFDTAASIGAGLEASLLIYDHGQSAAAIESAKAGVAAQRARLESTEQDVLGDTVAAFMDIRRDLRSVEVGRNNVSRLEEQVRASRDRFELGEITRTDVSLAESRLAAAQSDLAVSAGQLQVSREIYEAVVGTPPGNLQPPPAAPRIPATLAEAEAIAISRHPALRAAQFAQTGAEFDVARARGARGPSLSLSAGASIDNSEAQTGGRDENISASVGLRGNLPIYQGGRLSSLVRQAEAVLAQRRFDVQNTARLIRQNVSVAWSNLSVARAVIAANEAQVRAAQIALDGVREEATLGARTTLDVLDAEQELRDAQLRLVSAQRDEYVSVYDLLAAMGLLSVEYLNLGIPVYNPDVNYNRVQNAPYSTVEGTILDKLRDRYSR